MKELGDKIAIKLRFHSSLFHWVNQIVIFIFLVIGVQSPVHAVDPGRPHGITANGLGTVVSSGPNYDITGGTTKGANLFHSFGKFNVHAGEEAYFGFTGIQNIIGRVTGGEYSWLNGYIGADANLYFLNPAGVMFGPNASLDIAGSLHISTADYLRLADGGVFYADPAATSILTTAPPAAFGFLSDNPAGISIDGIFIDVSQGETISIVGGDIEIIGRPDPDYFLLYADSGRINIASVASAGEVIPNAPGDPPDLDVDSFERLGQIDISQNMHLDVSGDAGGGTVFIRGGRLMMDQSEILTYTSNANDAGDINIETTIAMDLSNRSSIGTIAYSSGNAGDIIISSPSLTLDEGDIRAESYGEGDSGDITLDVGRLILTQGFTIGNDTYGLNQGGTITISATDSISISGTSSVYGSSGLRSRTFGSGNAGRIVVSAPMLVMDDSGIIKVDTKGAGQGGEIVVDVASLILTGSETSIASDSGTYSTGKGGTITIRATDTVSVSGEARISAISEGSGDAGDIALDVSRLILTGGSEISNDSYGSGQGGTIAITATDSISISGTDESGVTPSGLRSRTYGVGHAGRITVSAPTLVMGEGGAGVIAVSTEGEGNAGEIVVDVAKLTLAGGATLRSDTISSGQGGKITINAADSISISGGGQYWWDYYYSGLSSEAWDSGNAGRITISTPALVMEDGLISTATYGSGHAGDIILDIASLTLTDGAWITSDTWDSGQGGTIAITATDAISISGVNNIGGYSSALYSEAYGSGMGGNIEIQARQLQLNNGAVISAASKYTGNAGSIKINVIDGVTLKNGSIQTEASIADGGDIEVNARHMVYLNGSKITASVGGGPETIGGNIFIDPQFVILKNGQIIANAFAGQGGNIQITAGTFLADPNSLISASSALGIDGTVGIDASVINMSGILAPLPKGFLSAAELLQNSCAARARGVGSISSFVIRGRDGLPLEPDGFLPSPVYFESDLEEKDESSL